MTDTSKYALDRLLDGVTPGPWAYNVHREVGPLHTEDDQAYGMICDAVCEVNFDADHLGNARFIAASRELVPALLAEREALTAEVARLTADTDLLLDAYTGMIVLRRMLDKSGLAAGADAAKQICDGIVAAHPEFPGRASLRTAHAARREGGV